jgi:hypothetical protein
MKRLHGALIVLLAILLLLPSAPVAHAAPPQQDALTSTFLILFPELRALPAPEWVQPGVRVTYSDMSASIAQVAGEEGTGGAGLLQYDLVARERRVVPLYARLFLDLGDGRYQSNLTYGVASPAGAGEFWVNPIALRRADSLNLPDLDVNRVQYEVAGERFDAVRFDYSGRGFVSAWVIDSESGLLLFSRTASEGTTHSSPAAPLWDCARWRFRGRRATHRAGCKRVMCSATKASTRPGLPEAPSRPISPSRQRSRWTRATHAGTSGRRRCSSTATQLAPARRLRAGCNSLAATGFPHRPSTSRCGGPSSIATRSPARP